MWLVERGTLSPRTRQLTVAWMDVKQLSFAPCETMLFRCGTSVPSTCNIKLDLPLSQKRLKTFPFFRMRYPDKSKHKPLFHLLQPQRWSIIEFSGILWRPFWFDQKFIKPKRWSTLQILEQWALITNFMPHSAALSGMRAQWQSARNEEEREKERESNMPQQNNAPAGNAAGHTRRFSS